MENQKSKDPNKIKKWIQESVLFKIAVIGFILILLMIPQEMVRSMISERSSASDMAKYEVSSMWGSKQHIAGPYLIIPVTEKRVVDDKTHMISHELTLLPSKLDWNASLQEEIRKRGIFSVLLYQSELNFTADFDLNDLVEPPNNSTIHWSNATLNMRITDLKGVKETIVLVQGEKKFPCKSGVKGESNQTGVHTDYLIDPKVNKFSFSASMSLNGTDGIYFEPLGKQTEIHISSTWESPKFSGYMLPSQRELDGPGFSADWNVLDLNRNYPQSWLNQQFQIHSNSLGVELIFPVNHYTKNHRAVRYSFLVISLVFMLYFFFEISRKKSVHPIQYILVGLNLSLFFLLLLSLSEHLGFNKAYLISASAHVLVLGIYSSSIFKTLKARATLVGIMTFIFVYIFVLLQQEDFALIVGTISLFIFLSVFMLATRNLDWYRLKRGEIPD